MKREFLPALAGVLLAGCYQLPLEPHHVVGSEPVEPAEMVAAPPPRPEPAVLYARDGTPVPTDGIPAETAPVATETGPTRALEAPQESRLYLLELYQRAVDERDELAFEVDGLAADLEAARGRERQLGLENAELRGSLAEAQREIERLVELERELAGRLATAQIRRLEAEKVLLETTLEWDRLNRMNRRPEGGEQ